VRGATALAIGVLATIATAALTIATADVGRYQSRVPAAGERPGWLPASWAAAADSGERSRGTSWGFSWLESEIGRYSLRRDEFGWPFRAVVRYSAGVPHVPGDSFRGEAMRAFFAEFDAAAGLRAGVNLPRWVPRDTSLGPEVAVWPQWPGLVMNVALYAGMVLLLWWGPGAARRRVRRRRGWCVACGYDLKGSGGSGGVCPECGGRG
jgi:hypothetical protein